VSSLSTPIPGFYFQHVCVCFFKIQILVLHCNFPGFWVQTEFLTGFFWNIAEDVADLRARRCIFPQADFVELLCEDGGIVIGVGDINPYLGGPSSLRLSPIHSREDQVKAALALPIQGFLQH
uniref:Uncharacterized protein n=1 Tax=Chrysemys picta bellii TaxID=8478 RepID=A0A8C3FLS0_CHRPI